MELNSVSEFNQQSYLFSLLTSLTWTGLKASQDLLADSAVADKGCANTKYGP